MCVLCYQIDTWNLPMFSFGGKKMKEKKIKHFQAVFWGGAHWHMFSPDLVRANCSRAVTGCEPALRAAVNESN